MNTNTIKRWIHINNYFLKIVYELIPEYLEPFDENSIYYDSNKEKPTKNPHPLTDRAKKNRLREDYISAVAKKLKDNSNLQFPDFNNDYNLQKLIRGSGLSENKRPKDSTLQQWIRDARKKVEAKPKSGKPSKKVKKSR